MKSLIDKYLKKHDSISEQELYEKWDSRKTGER